MKGLMPILATPFQSNGALDLRGLRAVTAFQIDSRASGVAVFGMASEGFALTRSDRSAILKTVREVTGDALPVIAGVSATSTATALEQAREAEEHGADALMVTPPHMVKPPAGSLLEFYGEISSSVSIPIMVQDAPVMTGVPMPVAAIAELSRLAGVTSVKVEAPPTVPKIDAVVQSIDTPGFTVVGGQNSQFVLDEYARGSVGTMPACEFTDVLQPVLDAWEAGRESDAREQFRRLLPLIIFGLQSGIAWAVHKEVLVARGLIDDPFVRYPAAPLDGRTRHSLAQLLEDLRLPSLRGASVTS